MTTELNTWRAFFVCNDLVKPVIHFFPQSLGSTAPYGVVCKISIFGANVHARSLTLEGARLNQPDGIRLDALFPELIQGVNGMVGVDVQLNSTQRRLDMSSSQVVVELVKGKSSTRYFAALVDETSCDRKYKIFPVFEGSEVSTTLIAINGGNQPTRVGYTRVEGRKSEPVSAHELDPYSVLELGESSGTGLAGSNSPEANSVLSVTEEASGSFGVKPILPGVYGTLNEKDGKQQSENGQGGVVYYQMIRDLRTRSPISIQAI